MDCPRCSVPLEHRDYKGIEVDRCPQCEGLWLDHPELDQLEDTVMDDDPSKGTMVYAVRPSDISCPKCDGPMRIFNYRAYNLPIDECESQHGFWLDGGEEKRVLELMNQRMKDLKRSGRAEEDWGKLLKGFKSRSFSDKIKGLFR
ncbi:MAG: zf-TFIIB domain-containing protein [Chloroflexi bacterium]|nr:zf-TFIIB domain-containing protein [Chloroflexota bacterium]